MKKINLLQAIFFTLMTSALFAQDGSLDLTFGINGLAYHPVPYAITTSAIQPDGKIVMAGWSDAGDFALARFDPAGILDGTFGLDGIVTTSIDTIDDRIYSIALQPDGKIIAVGYSKNENEGLDFTLARFDATGSLDTNFGNDGIVISDFPFGLGHYVARSVAIQADEKIVAAGYVDLEGDTTGQFIVARYNADGSLDDSFGIGGALVTDLSPGRDWVRSVVIQADGKIVATGYSGFATDKENFALARYHPNGTLDSSFGTGGMTTTDFINSRDLATSSILQPDGKIIVTGYTWMGTKWNFALAKYDTNGSLDDDFGFEGKIVDVFGSSTSIALDVALQTDGKIVAAGWMDSGTNSDFAISRYNPDGSKDNSFGIDGQITTDFYGFGDIATEVHILADGKIVATGSSGIALTLARYLSDLNVGVLDFSLLKNPALIYPNPVLDQATLEFTLKQKESISIQLVDLQGRTLKTFIKNEILEAGEHVQAITLPNGLSAGAYYIVMSTANGQVSIKIFV